MIAEVGNSPAVPLDTIANRRTAERYRTNTDLCIADCNVVDQYVVEPDSAPKLAEVHREIRRPHEVTEHLSERTLLLRWAVDIELSTNAICRREERKTRHVIPVDVGNKRRSTETPIGGLGLAEKAKAGAEIENDRSLVGDLQC